LVHSGLKRRLISLRHISVRSDLGARDLGARRGVASTIDSGSARSVRIVLLRAKTTPVRDSLEGRVHETTVAASVVSTSVTGHEHLFGERHEVAVLVEVSTFQSTSGGERPARAARALVLHVGHTTLSGPVPSRGSGLHFLLRSRVHSGASLQHRSGDRGEVSLHELGVRHARELVVGHLPAGARGVVLLDELVPANEDLESSQELLTILELSIVLSHPVEELLFVVLSVVSHGRDGKKDQKSDNLIEHGLFNRGL
jgi:hypothetical protein